MLHADGPLASAAMPRVLGRGRTSNEAKFADNENSGTSDEGLQVITRLRPFDQRFPLAKTARFPSISANPEPSSDST